jgi:site-specific recombinase XerC
MAFLFKPSRTVVDPKTGKKKTVRDRKWYVRYRDARGALRTRAGFTDKQATKQLAAQLDRDSARQQVGLPTSAGSVRLGPLAQMLDEHMGLIAAKGRTARYVRETRQRIRDVLDGCRWVKASDVEADQLVLLLHRWRKDGMGATSSNHYLTAVRGFTRWLFDKIDHADPLRKVKKLDAGADLRRVRRTLPADLFNKLVETTRASNDVVCRTAGPDRAMLYVTAAYTGLRAAELGSLTPERVALDGDTPSATVLAAYSKNRREAQQPVHPDLVPLLRTWLAARPVGQPLWPGRWHDSRRAAKMIRHDLAAAGIPYKDRDGRVYDFHALRAQYITDLARSGVGLTHAQKLARHGNPKLTANFYTHLDRKELTDAVAKLPPPLRPRNDQ